MSPKIYLSLFALALYFLPQLSAAATIDTTDGSIEDWADVPVLYEGIENITGTDYWYNSAAGQWQTTDPGYDTFLVNQEKMLDILEFRMTNDNEQLCFLMESVRPFMGVTQESTGLLYPYGYPLTYDQAGIPLTLVPGAPASFDHSLVLTFDINHDDLADYYAAMNLVWSQGGSGQSALQVTRTIYQDNGDGVFNPETDSLLNTMLNPAESVSIDSILSGGGSMPNTIEVCQALIGDEGFAFLEFRETVQARLETHSDIGDQTDFVDYTVAAEAVTSPALVVGAGRAARGMAKGNVKVYDLTDGAELLSFTAYEKSIGAKVATGDIDGDGLQEIVTLPWKQFKNPELKIFDTAGNLEMSNRIYTKGKKGYSLHNQTRKYNLAVGDVNGDDTDEIILAFTKTKQLHILVLTINSKHQLKVLSLNVLDSEGYTKDAWVSVANIDASTDELEIVTSPFQGAARFDVWQWDSQGVHLLAEQVIDTKKRNYQQGLHIAADTNKVYTYARTNKAQINNYKYAAEALTQGNMEIDTCGSIGDLVKAGDYLAVSPWEKKLVKLYDTDGNIALSINTNTKAGFLAYLE